MLIVEHFWLTNPVWPQPIPKVGSETITISLTESAGKDAIGIIVQEGFEDTTYDVAFGSTNEWIRTNARSHSGSWCWTNPDISDSQFTDSIVIVPDTATSVQFWYSVDSESSFDYFRFLIDGVQQFQVSGVVGWTQSTSYNVTAGQQLTFRYFKDGSSSTTIDAAFVDDLTFMGPTGPPPIDHPVSETDTISLTGVASVDKALEQLIYPDAALTQTNLTGAVTDIDEDPASPDANWMTGGGAVVLRVSFPTPTSNLVTTINQEFRVRVRPGT